MSNVNQKKHYQYKYYTHISYLKISRKIIFMGNQEKYFNYDSIYPC